MSDITTKVETELAAMRAKLDAAERKLKAIDTWGKAELIAKLNASERAAAAMREVLAIARDYVLNLPLEGTIDVAARIDHALDSNAGRDCVHRSEVDAAWRKGMEDAISIVREYANELRGAHVNTNESCAAIRRRLHAARNAKTTLPQPPTLPTGPAR